MLRRMARMTWDERERPILEAIAAGEAGRDLNNDDVAEATGLSRDDVDRGLLALYEADYVTGTDAAAEELCYLLGMRLLERGRRAVGVWPADDSGEALLDLLRARIADADTDEERSRWQRLFDAAKGLGGTALRELTVAYLKHVAPGL